MHAPARSMPASPRGLRLPFALGCAFMALIAVPALGDPPGGMSIAHGVMFAGIPFWYAAAATRKTLVLDATARFGVGIILACLAFLIVWAFLSVLASDDPLKAGRPVVTLLAGFAVFFLIAGTVTRDRLDILADLLCLALAATCLISVLAYFEPTLRGMIFKGTDRAFGFFKNSNQFGMAISTLLPVAAAGFLGRRQRRAVRGAGLAALLVGLVLTGSKTNLLISSLTLVFVLCAYSILAYSGARRVAMLTLSLFASAAALVAIYALLVTLNPRAVRLFEEFFADGEGLQSLAARSELWHRSLTQFYADPVFGQGAGQPLDTYYADQLVTHSHNVLLDYLRTLGAPGFVVFSVMIGTVVALSVGSLRLAFGARGADTGDRILCVGLAVAPLAYLAANLSSDSMGPSTSAFFWSVLFLGLAARLLIRRE